MDNVNARVSINDIFLAQSIMTRRTLTLNDQPPTATATATPSQMGGGIIYHT